MDVDIRNLRIPWSVIVAAMSLAAGSGGTVALAKGQIDHHEVRIEDLEKSVSSNRERLVRIETLLEHVTKAVERIERKLDRDGSRDK